MTDLIEILRAGRSWEIEAADEIERLTAELEGAKQKAEMDYAIMAADTALINGRQDDIATLKAQYQGAKDAALLKDWLEFAKDVQPGCAMGAEWLDSLRARTKAAMKEGAK